MSSRNHYFNSPRFYANWFTLSGTAPFTQTVSVDLHPEIVLFYAAPSVSGMNVNDDAGTGGSTMLNYSGSSFGMATLQPGGSISNGCVHSGGSGNSINEVSRYSSNSYSIGVRYADMDGVALGYNEAYVSSVSDGSMEITADTHDNDLLVFFLAIGR